MEKVKILKEYQNDPELNYGDKCSNYSCYYGVEQSFIKKDLSDKAKKRIEEINNIMKYLICGFNCFYNFTENKVRYSYDYGGHFIGVGYISIDELQKLEDEKI